MTTWKRETKLLLSSDSDEEDIPTPSSSKNLSINKDYASRYENWRGKEEIQKFKDKFGSSSLEKGVQDSNSESSSSESEEELISAVNDKHFLKALSCLKKKDPIIYDGNLNFFPENKNINNNNDNNNKVNNKIENKKKKKPFLLKDHERKMILENNNGNISSDNENPTNNHDNTPISSVSYFEEQHNIKKGITAVAQNIDSDESDDNNDDDDRKLLLTKRQKSIKEVNDEEEDYKKWLKGQIKKLDGPANKKDAKELKYLHDYWNDPKLDDGEQFLRDYILNQKYIEKIKEDYIPTYDEIIHDSDSDGLSGDESNLQKMEEFELKYNFRYEEPDNEFIKKYPRTIENSIRRKENKRKIDRNRLRDIKKNEKKKKLNDIQQLKSFSHKQILNKIRLLQESSGDKDIHFTENDISGDFDPNEYDNRANEIFNDEFYSKCDDTQKPIFSDMEDMDDDEEEHSTEFIIEPKNPKDKLKQEQEPLKQNDDNDIDIGGLDLMIKKKKDKKIKRILKTTLEKEKLKKLKLFENKKFQDEYYKHDFEDIIGGDIPCRFKYREVIPNDFGLSTDEILMATDQELNHWSSIKKTYLYRSNEEEQYDVHAYEVKRSDINKKKRVLTSIYSTETTTVGAGGAEEEEPNCDVVVVEDPSSNVGQKNKKKNKSNKNKNDSTILEEIMSSTEINEPTTLEKKKKRKRKGKGKKCRTEQINETPNSGNTLPSQPSTSESIHPKKKFKKGKSGSNRKSIPAVALIPTAKPDRLLAFGINPKKYEKWTKYGKNQS